MDEAHVRNAVLDQLVGRGFTVSKADGDEELLALGVNSITLIHILSALEDEFDVDLDASRLFAQKVTIGRVQEEIISRLT